MSGHDDSLRIRVLIQSTYVVVALYFSAYYYFAITFSDRALHYDTREVWHPLARAVLDGQPLYLGVAADNKPPLFQFVNIIFELTGHYVIAFVVLVGLGNGVISYLLYRYARQFSSPRTSFLSGLLFAFSIPLIDAFEPNVRSFAIVFLLISLLSKSAIIRGISYAIGGLFSQWIVVVAPILAYLEHTNDGMKGFSKFLLGGSFVVLISYVAVFLVWGSESVIAGIANTMFPFASYSTVSAAEKVAAVVVVATRSSFIIVPAAIVAAISVSQGGGLVDNTRAIGGSERDQVLLTVLLAALLLIPLLVKGHAQYWMYSMSFLAVLASLFYSEMNIITCLE